MFDNLLFQNAGNLIIEDIQRNRLPQSVLFSGPSGSGKLTCALELARVLSCRRRDENVPSAGGAEWLCDCPSCLRHKALAHTELLVMGPRDCILEIRSAQKAFLDAASSNLKHIQAVRYLFIRSIRKLTIRFNPVLWEGEDTKLIKAVSLLAGIDELLEELDPLRILPEPAKLIKYTDSLISQCEKLEQGFLYDSIPVSQIRRAALWARFTPTGSKKMLVIENADYMQESARNALLKILEESPKNVMFVLTTCRRGAVMATILSRVRTYGFVDRSPPHQQEIINRVFHDDGIAYNSLADYLNTFLPVSPRRLEELSALFIGRILARAAEDSKQMPVSILWALKKLSAIQHDHNEEISNSFIINESKNFEPRILFRIFLTGIIKISRLSLRSPETCVREHRIVQIWIGAVQEALESVTIYNQSPAAALDLLGFRMGSGL